MNDALRVDRGPTKVGWHTRHRRCGTGRRAQLSSGDFRSRHVPGHRPYPGRLRTRAGIRTQPGGNAGTRHTCVSLSVAAAPTGNGRTVIQPLDRPDAEDSRGDRLPVGHDNDGDHHGDRGEVHHATDVSVPTAPQQGLRRSRSCSPPGSRPPVSACPSPAGSASTARGTRSHPPYRARLPAKGGRRTRPRRLRTPRVCNTGHARDL